MAKASHTCPVWRSVESLPTDAAVAAAAESCRLSHALRTAGTSSSPLAAAFVPREPVASDYVPLWCGCCAAGSDQAQQVAESLAGSGLVQAGGLATTLAQGTGQQWDWPNAWPPLQHMAIEGLSRYCGEPGGCCSGCCSVCSGVRPQARQLQGTLVALGLALDDLVGQRQPGQAPSRGSCGVGHGLVAASRAVAEGTLVLLLGLVGSGHASVAPFTV